MSSRSFGIAGLGTGVKLGVLLCFGWAAFHSQAAESHSPPPAKVENAVPEGSLVILKLTRQAEQRLGILLAEITRKKILVSRLFGGDVIVPLAPKNGTPTGLYPLATATTEELIRLADQQAVADGETEKAKIQLEAAQRTLKRAEKLIQDDAGSVRALDDATAQVQFAAKSLEVANVRRALLGAPVSEAMQRQRIWVRVPVYAGELKLLDTSQEASVSSLGARPGDRTFLAKPTPAPPFGHALTATVDLFYELQGDYGSLAPGHRVSVQLPLRGEEESLVAPWASILHDINGNTWVYENVAPQTFTRRRVEVSRIIGNDAVLASGPKPGAKVVTDGAAELFGTEFGGGK